MLNYQCARCGGTFEEEPDRDDMITCPYCLEKTPACDVDFIFPQGYQIGGFEILRLIGRGGTGNVYLANQVSMQRPVALKVLLKSQTRDKGSLMHFLDEVKTLGRIQHQNVVTALDAGEDNGIYFLAMQFVAGDTLDARIDNGGPIPQSEALDYVLDIAKALDYVWQKYKMFHRDIKPGNIIINEDGEAVLLDMGIAQSRGESSIQNGHIEGSPFYMSPEQIRGEKLTWSTDLYSLGATLYHLVVGVPPYDDSSDIMRILEQHTSAPFPMPETRNPSSRISPQLISLMRRMMAKKPEKRFGSWKQFLSEARKIRKSLPAKKAGAQLDAENAARQKKRLLTRKQNTNTVKTRRQSGNPVMLGINLLILLVIACGVGYYFLARNNTANAIRYYDEAAEMLKQGDEHLESAVDLLGTARLLAAKTGVDPEKRKKIHDAYFRLKKISESRAAEDARVQALLDVQKDQYAKLKNTMSEIQEALRKGENVDPARAEALVSQFKELMAQLSELAVSSSKNKQELEYWNGFLKRDLAFCEALKGKIKHTNSPDSREISPDGDVSSSPGELSSPENSGRKVEKGEGKAGKETAEQPADPVLAAKTGNWKNLLRKNLVVTCRRSGPAAAAEQLVLPDFLKEEKEDSSAAQQTLLLQTERWLTQMKAVLRNAQNLAEALGNVKRELRRTSAMKLFSISPERRKEVFAYLLLYGYFAEAGKLADTSAAKQETLEFARSYLSWRLGLLAKQNDAEIAGKTLEVLDRLYGSMPEYLSLKKSILGETAARNRRD